MQAAPKTDVPTVAARMVISQHYHTAIRDTSASVHTTPLWAFTLASALMDPASWTPCTTHSAPRIRWLAKDGIDLTHETSLIIIMISQFQSQLTVPPPVAQKSQLPTVKERKLVVWKANIGHDGYFNVDEGHLKLRNRSFFIFWTK